MIIEGTILRGRSFEPVEGRVVVEDGEIAAIEEASARSDDIVMPAFVNAHTHLGDSVAKEAGLAVSREELFAPSDGLKQRLLAEADEADAVAAMAHSLRFMEASGTAACIDFRAGGVEGVRALEDAAGSLAVEPVVLGCESVAAMEASDGFGASSAGDGHFESERTATAEAGKLFGIHAGESGPGDINPALDLDPDFLVHMVHARDIHLERVADSEMPVVVCPRSNLVTDVGLPPVGDLLERTTVALGTDHVMLNNPSMFREMEFVSKLTDASPADVLRMATVNGADIAGLDCGLVAEGRDAKLLVLDGDSDNLAGARNVVGAVVRRAGVDDVTEVVLDAP